MSADGLCSVWRIATRHRPLAFSPASPPWESVGNIGSTTASTSRPVAVDVATKLIGARDPLGIRPLVLGMLDGRYILASETCALDTIGAKYIRDIENGEVVVRGYNVMSGYFETMQIPLLRGRFFTDEDTRDTPHVVVIDERMAEQLWPGADAVGKSGKSTGAGAEAAEGVHSMDERDPSENSGVSKGGAAASDSDRGSEPLEGRNREHRSGYGGAGGKPVSSADQPRTCCM